MIRSVLKCAAAPLIVFATAAMLMAAPPQPQAQAASEQLAVSYVQGPVSDCAQLAGMVLGGLAIRSGAALYSVGAGAGYGNAAQVINTLTGIAPSVGCVTYVAPRYIDLVCSRSRGPWWYRSTWEARALVALATRGKASTCH